MTRCGGKYKKQLAVNVLRSPTVKEFWKSVNIGQSYAYGAVFFLDQLIYTSDQKQIRGPVWQGKKIPLHRPRTYKRGFATALLSFEHKIQIFPILALLRYLVLEPPLRLLHAVTSLQWCVVWLVRRGGRCPASPTPSTASYRHFEVVDVLHHQHQVQRPTNTTTSLSSSTTRLPVITVWRHGPATDVRLIVSTSSLCRSS